jgi:peptidyl-tRNA hydrolase, PTH1 family
MTYDGLIVGLGNPGTKYVRTRHNFGFMLADRLVAHWAGQPGSSERSPQARLSAELWEVSEDYGARRWIVLKPQTFMNLSGQVVGELSRKHGIAADRILVLHDELDLPLGTAALQVFRRVGRSQRAQVRGRSSRDPGFRRLRIGIGRPEGSEAMAEYVLRSFLPAEWDLVGQCWTPASTRSFSIVAKDWPRHGPSARPLKPVPLSSC